MGTPIKTPPRANKTEGDGNEVTDEDGYQAIIDAEDVDVFVRSQTTRMYEKYITDINQMKKKEKSINRFVMNGEKNRYLNVPAYDELLDPTDKHFYVNANTMRTPFGNFIMAQAPLPTFRADFLQMIWLFNVQTIICLAPPEKIGDYFDVHVGGKVTILFKFTMTTLSKQKTQDGLTIYQLKLAPWKKNTEPRIIYMIVTPTILNGVRDTKVQIAAMEEMWAFEEAAHLSGEASTTVLVHGLSGTRRTGAFVAATLMCKQILEAGTFSAMDTWVEVRSHRCGTAARKIDFFSSLHVVFDFAVRCGYVDPKDQAYVKSIAALKKAITLDVEHYKKEPDE
ncbi:unnamed protein product [Caenorhabditis auriculariae]|uniref:Tyrosine-protein phosphatase domain-containing protein n=1 Tax=Caenorhabditis auriculariae TaxID=2777116 RepID=A0A8S1GPL9_9PELO|nr:unnamed protein product [Caenorhabditis auriculariae]